MADERGDRTPKCSRIKRRTPATDSSGGKASAKSLISRRSSLAEADTIDFQSDLFSFAAALDLMPPFSTLDLFRQNV